MSEVEIDWLERVPLRDGVALGVRLYRPRDAGPLPAALTMTPYGMDRDHEMAMALARGGYAVAVADCRGRGESEGTFDPSFCDAADGYDAVEWLGAHPSCDGRVAMFGGSYQGENQWATAAARPPALRAILPAAATYMPADRAWRGPQRMPYMLVWLLLVSGRTAPFALFAERAYWQGAFARHMASGRAFRDLPRSLGATAPWFDPYLDRPAHDPFWQRLAIAPETWTALDIPVLTITGLYDDAQTGALSYAAQHEAWGDPSRHHVVIGPWDHAGTRTGRPRSGEAGAMDLAALALGFLDWALKGAPKPAALRDRVTWFDTGAEAWHGAPSLAAAGPGRRTLPLSEMEGGSGEGRSWRSDPRAYDPEEAARPPFPDTVEEEAPPAGAHWLSAPLPAPLALAGHPRLVLCLSTDLPDADLEAILAAVAPDGAVTRLGEDRQRLRYRAGTDHETFDHGAPAPVAFADFPFAGRTLPAGARLRLTVRTLASVHFQRNFQGGGAVDDEAASDARAGTIRVHHAGSRLELPVHEAAA